MAKQVEYWIMVKPRHAVYGVPVPGLGQLSQTLPNVNNDEIETLYFRRKIQSCGCSCGYQLSPVKQPVWALFTTAYNLHELRTAYQRAMKAWDKGSIKVLQRISHKSFVTN